MNIFIRQISNMKSKNKILLLFASLLILILSTSIFIENQKIVQTTITNVYDDLIYTTRQNAEFINSKYFNNMESISNLIKIVLLTHYDTSKIYDIDYILNDFIMKEKLFILEVLQETPYLNGISIYFQKSPYDNLKLTPKIHIHNIEDNIINIEEEIPKDVLDKIISQKIFVLKKGVWSNPIVLYGEKVLAYSIPVYLMEKPFAVITLYLAYKNIDEFINTYILRNTGYAYILNENFILLSHPHLKYYINNRLDTIIPQLQDINKSNKLFDIIKYTFQNEEKIAVWHKLQTGDFLIIVGTTKEFLKEINNVIYINNIISFLFICITLITIYIMILDFKTKLSR